MASDDINYHTRRRILSELREEDVCNYLAGRGYRLLSWGDGEHSTRRVFQIPAGVGAADIVAEVSVGRAIIAEVKGADLDKAIRQLRDTVPYVRKSHRHISCKVFTSEPVPSTEPFETNGGTFSRLGYRAVRVFRAQYPGEWPLWLLKEGGQTEVLRMGDEQVTLVFGPYRK